MQLLERQKFDLVFLDYLLTDGKGLDLLNWLTGEKVDVPVIAVTGHGDELVAAGMIKAGASDYLPKANIHDKTLAHCISNALEKFRLKKEVENAVRKMAHMATRDPLTGLFKRHYVNDVLEKEFSRAPAPRAPFNLPPVAFQAFFVAPAAREDPCFCIRRVCDKYNGDGTHAWALQALFPVPLTMKGRHAFRLVFGTDESPGRRFVRRLPRPFAHHPGHRPVSNSVTAPALSGTAFGPGRVAIGDCGPGLLFRGLDLALFPLGRTMAQQLAESAHAGNAEAWSAYGWIYLFAFAVGFSTTIAEPSLIALADKAEAASHRAVSALGLRIAVAVGGRWASPWARFASSRVRPFTSIFWWATYPWPFKPSWPHAWSSRWRMLPAAPPLSLHRERAPGRRKRSSDSALKSEPMWCCSLVAPILSAIEEAGRLSEPGTGIALVLPVEQVAGMESQTLSKP